MGLFDSYRNSALPQNGLSDYNQNYISSLQPGQAAMGNLLGSYQNQANQLTGISALNMGAQQAANNLSLTQMSQLMQQQSIQAAIAPPPKVDLEKDPGWSATITELTDMWLAKFGSNWAVGSDVYDDPFYVIAMQRLRKLGKVEAHTVNGSDVFRLVE